MNPKVLLYHSVVIALAGISCDYQEAPSSIPVSVVNDSASTQTLHQCTDAVCRSIGESFELSSGRSITVNTSNDGVDNWYVVASQGRVLGCLNLRFDNATGRPQVRTSARRTCPGP